jgi:hypothetical protein
LASDSNFSDPNSEIGDTGFRYRFERSSRCPKKRASNAVCDLNTPRIWRTGLCMQEAINALGDGPAPLNRCAMIFINGLLALHTPLRPSHGKPRRGLQHAISQRAIEGRSCIDDRGRSALSWLGGEGTCVAWRPIGWQTGCIDCSVKDSKGTVSNHLQQAFGITKNCLASAIQTSCPFHRSCRRSSHWRRRNRRPRAPCCRSRRRIGSQRSTRMRSSW